MKRLWQYLHEFRPGDEFVCILVGEGVLALLDILCYREWIWLIFLQVLLLPYLRQVHIFRKKREKMVFERGFQRLLQNLTASLQAGLSLENAFMEAAAEDHHPLFSRELDRIVRGLGLHIPLDELFYDFALRADSDEIYEFAAVLEIVRMTGGNMVEIARDAVTHLRRKLEAGEEIQVILSGRIFEKNMMLVMPFLILAYLRITNPGYVSCLYHNPAGYLIMTGMIACVVSCFFWTEKIMDIGL